MARSYHWLCADQKFIPVVEKISAHFEKFIVSPLIDLADRRPFSPNEEDLCYGRHYQ
jgi:hypothetical protein